MNLKYIQKCERPLQFQEVNEWPSNPLYIMMVIMPNIDKTMPTCIGRTIKDILLFVCYYIYLLFSELLRNCGTVAGELYLIF